MIIFSAAVSADVSPPLAEDSAACMVSSLNRKNYLSNFHMIIFSAAVTADVSPPLAEDSAACMVSYPFRRNYLSNFHMIIFSAAVSADVSPLPPQAGRMTLRLSLQPSPQTSLRLWRNLSASGG
jgi:hypothetical protein